MSPYRQLGVPLVSSQTTAILSHVFTQVVIVNGLHIARLLILVVLWYERPQSNITLQ